MAKVPFIFDELFVDPAAAIVPAPDLPSH
jgi:hypothetical protein